VDLQRKVIRHDVSTGIAAEALAWVLPNRLIGGLQNGDVLTVDTSGGQVGFVAFAGAPKLFHRKSFWNELR
jgi:hypothetical protein